MDSALLVHRLHFAFTVTFHYLFPQLTMGLALLIVVLKTAGAAPQRRNLQPGRALLGAHLRHQFRHWRGHRHSHGISVRHQLGAFLALRRRRHRANPRHGRRVRLLPGVRLPGLFLFGEKRLSPRGIGGRQSRYFSAPGFPDSSSSPPMPGCSIPSAMPWLLTVRPAHQLLGADSESLGVVAVCSQYERRRYYRLLSSWLRWARSIYCGASTPITPKCSSKSASSPAASSPFCSCFPPATARAACCPPSARHAGRHGGSLPKPARRAAGHHWPARCRRAQNR